MDGLSSICAGFGTLQEDDNGNRIGYEKGDYCSDNLKDLLRFLRLDEPETRDMFKQFCKWNILGKDLIPIIEYFQISVLDLVLKESPEDSDEPRTARALLYKLFYDQTKEG